MVQDSRSPIEAAEAADSFPKIIQAFLDGLDRANWTRATGEQMAKVVNFVREQREWFSLLEPRVKRALDLSDEDMRMLLTLTPQETLSSFEWRALSSMGPGSNVLHDRAWDLYPRDGFFGDYLEYTLNSEAPIEFHFYVAACTLGAATKRNFVLKVGHNEVFPNLWAVLVAESGICRKTSACNIGRKLYARVPEANVITSTSTPEYLVEQLKTDPSDIVYDEKTEQLDFHYAASQGFIIAAELPVFLGKQQYNEGMIQRLTELSDNPDDWAAGTRKDGRMELYNVSLSLLGGITPDSLKSSIPRAAHGGGFMSRILWISKVDTPRLIPLPPPASPLLRERLVKHLCAVAVATPAVLTFTPEAMEWFAEWYADEREKMGASHDRKVSGYHERKPSNLWRLAALLYLAQPKHQVREIEGRREAAIPLDLLKQARDIIEYIEEPLFEAVLSVDTAPVHEHLQKVRKAMWRLTGGVKDQWVMRSDLMRAMSMHVNAQELNKLIDTLIETHELERDIRKIHSRTVTYYTLGKESSPL